MPRFFFDIVIDGHALPDEHGADLPDIAAAHAELVRSTGEYIRDVPATLLNEAAEWAMRLRDGSGHELFRFELKAVRAG